MLLKIREGSKWHIFDHVEDMTYTYQSLSQKEYESVDDIHQWMDKNGLGRNLCTGIRPTGKDYYPYYQVIMTRPMLNIGGTENVLFTFDDIMYILNDDGQTIDKIKCIY